MGQILATVLEELSNNLQTWEASQRATTLHRIFRRFHSEDLWLMYRRYRTYRGTSIELNQEQARDVLGPTIGVGPFLFIWDVFSIADSYVDSTELLCAACIFSSCELLEKGRLFMVLFDVQGRGSVSLKCLCTMGRLVVEILAKCVPLCATGKSVYAALRKEMGSFSSCYADGKDALSFEREGVIAHADLAALLTPIEPAYYKLPIAKMGDAIGGGGCTDGVTTKVQKKASRGVASLAEEKKRGPSPARGPVVGGEVSNAPPYGEPTSTDSMTCGRVDTPVVRRGETTLAAADLLRASDPQAWWIAPSLQPLDMMQLSPWGPMGGPFGWGSTFVTYRVMGELFSPQGRGSGIVEGRGSVVSDGVVDSDVSDEEMLRREVEVDVASGVARGAALVAIRSLRGRSRGDSEEEEEATTGVADLSRTVVDGIIQEAITDLIGSDCGSSGAASSVATNDAGVSWDAAELSRMVVDDVIQEVIGALIGSDRSDGISVEAATSIATDDPGVSLDAGELSRAVVDGVVVEVVGRSAGGVDVASIVAARAPEDADLSRVVVDGIMQNAVGRCGHWSGASGPWKEVADGITRKTINGDVVVPDTIPGDVGATVEVADLSRMVVGGVVKNAARALIKINPIDGDCVTPGSTGEYVGVADLSRVVLNTVLECSVSGLNRRDHSSVVALDDVGPSREVADLSRVVVDCIMETAMSRLKQHHPSRGSSDPDTAIHDGGASKEGADLSRLVVGRVIRGAVNEVVRCGELCHPSGVGAAGDGGASKEVADLSRLVVDGIIKATVNKLMSNDLHHHPNAAAASTTASEEALLGHLVYYRALITGLIATMTNTVGSVA